MGLDRTAAEPAALGELVALCARLPLALAIVAARAAARPGFPLAALAADLRDESGRLDALDAGDAASSVRAVFSWSYRHLTEPAARMFRLLGVHPGPDISLPAAASLTGSRPADARDALAELTRLHLVAEHAHGRCGFHDLLRAYAAEQARARDGETGRSAAVHRLLDHYLHTACEAAQLLDPARDRISLDTPACGTAPELLAGYDQSLAWFDAEHPVLLASVRLAAEAGFDAWAWRLPSALTDFLYLRGHWPDMAATQQTALAAAQRLGDAPGQALACRHLARAHSLLGSRQDAEVFYRRALSLYQQLGDHIGQGRCHYGLAWSAQREGRHEVALDHGRQALAEFRAAGHRDGQATALNAIGWFHAHLGDYQQALACCERALALCRELGDRHSEAATWDSLGYARHHLGQHAEAIGCYQRALALFRELRDSYNEAATLINLGDTHQALGDALAARGAWQQALAILDDLRHPDAEMVRDKLGPAIADPSLPT
jgi:tetratricopeptide (TPR) repeat protein